MLPTDTVMRNVGIGLSIFGSFATSGGMVLQKMVKKHVEVNPDAGPEFAHFKYIFGLVAVVVGLLCKTVICGLLPQLTLAALSAQSFLYSAILEYLFLDVSLSWVSIGSLLVCFVGLSLAIIGSEIADVDYSLRNLESLYLRTSAIIFSSSGVIFLVVPRLFLPGKSNELGIFDLIYRVVSSALLASWYGVFLKAFVEATMYMFIYGGEDLENHVVAAFVIVLLGLVFGLSKLRFISYSQQFFHPLLFQPLFHSLSVLLHVLCGILYFRELSVKYTRGHLEDHLYFCGIAALVVGLAVISMEYDPSVNFLEEKDEPEKDGLLETYGETSQYGPRHSGDPRRGDMRQPPSRSYEREDLEHGNSRGRGSSGRGPSRDSYEYDPYERDDSQVYQQRRQGGGPGPGRVGYGSGPERNTQYGRGGQTIYDGYNPALDPHQSSPSKDLPRRPPPRGGGR